MRGALRTNRLRATNMWPLLFVALLLTASFVIVFNTEANTSQMVLQLCRANVEPCQTELNIPVGGSVDLDLVLGQANPIGGTPGPGIVAWETHLKLSDTPVAGLEPKTPSGRPVQEQGAAGLALEGLVSLQNSGNQDSGQYFTARNRYDPASGHLDYSVTLVGFDPARPQPRVLPFSNTFPLRLGRITVRGTAQGHSEISPEASVPHPLQVVTLSPSGVLGSVGVNTPAGSLSTISVDNVSTPELRGQISPVVALPTVLTVTFWKTGATPPWQGGSAQPVATFRNVPTDASGQFRITDLAPAILPPGVYDMRVKGRRTLGGLAPGLVVPVSSGGGTPPAIATVTLGSLREGDIDGNNVVDSGDVLGLVGSFGKLEAAPGFNPDADIDSDSVVDVLDFTRLAENFGERGD